jgi:excisionase family DNA binding protein
MSDKVTVTIKEASELLKLDISTIYKAIKTGRLEVEIISIGNKKIKKVKKKI